MSTRGSTTQNSPPPHESTNPPARSIASQKGSVDRTRSSALASSMSSAALTAATTSCRESSGKSSSGSRSMSQTVSPGPAVIRAQDVRLTTARGVAPVNWLMRETVVRITASRRVRLGGTRPLRYHAPLSSRGWQTISLAFRSLTSSRWKGSIR